MNFNKLSFMPNTERDILIGDVILFERKGLTIYGIVELIRERSVIVHINESAQEFLLLDNHLTVVNHKNYKVVQRYVVCENGA